MSDRIAQRRTFIGDRLFQKGEVIPADLAPGGRATAKSTPLGELSIEQLEAALAAKRAAASKAEAPAPKPAKAAKEPKADLPQLDRDKKDGPGGSLKKADIAAKLDELGVEYDADADRDVLAAVLADAEKAKA